MRLRFPFLTGLTVGATLMYLYDPDRGAHRRTLMRDKLRRTAHNTRSSINKTWQQAKDRLQGVRAEARGARAEEHIADDTLVQRVRSEIGHVVSHAHNVFVDALEGRVILSGVVEQDEIEKVVARARAVRGVRAVDNRLEVRH